MTRLCDDEVEHSGSDISSDEHLEDDEEHVDGLMCEDDELGCVSPGTVDHMRQKRDDAILEAQTIDRYGDDAIGTDQHVQNRRRIKGRKRLRRGKDEVEEDDVPSPPPKRHIDSDSWEMNEEDFELIEKEMQQRELQATEDSQMQQYQQEEEESRARTGTNNIASYFNGGNAASSSSSSSSSSSHRSTSPVRRPSRSRRTTSPVRRPSRSRRSTSPVRRPSRSRRSTSPVRSPSLSSRGLPRGVERASQPASDPDIMSEEQQQLADARKALINICPTVVFTRGLQPYGSVDDIMKSSTREQLMQTVDDMYSVWGGNEMNEMSILETFEFAVKKYPYESPMHLFSLQRTYIGQLGNIMTCLQSRGLLNPDDKQNMTVVWQIRQIATRITRFYESVSRAVMGRNSCRSNPDFNMIAITNGIVGDLRNAVKIDSATQGEMQVLNEFASMGIRRSGDTLWRPSYAKDANGKNVFINSFEHFYIVADDDSFEDIINSLPQYSRVSPHWDHVSHNSRQVAERLRSMNNVHLPRLVTNARYLSFRNGQYDLIADVLIPYGVGHQSGERTEFSPMSFKDKHLDICDDLRDDQDFRTGQWYQLRKKCPNFFKMVSYQYPAEPIPFDANYNGYKTPEMDIRLLLAFLGRLLVPINLLEKWQKALAIIGMCLPLSLSTRHQRCVASLPLSLSFTLK